MILAQNWSKQQNPRDNAPLTKQEVCLGDSWQRSWVTAWLHTRWRSRFSYTDWLSLVYYGKQEQFNRSPLIHFCILKFSLIVRSGGHKLKKWLNMIIQFPLFVSAMLNFNISKVVLTIKLFLFATISRGHFTSKWRQDELNSAKVCLSSLLFFSLRFLALPQINIVRRK